LNKLLPLLAFSILLLVPISQDVFATHEAPPTLNCPAGSHVGNMGPNACLADNIPHPGAGNPTCLCINPTSHPDCVFSGDQLIVVCVRTSGAMYVDGTETLDPPITVSEQCQDNAILDPLTNHCVPDFPNICSTGTIQAGFTCIVQAMNNLVGGTLLETNTLPLLVGAIGVNPIITGLVGITIAGIAGQAVWFVHRRKKNSYE